MKIGLLIATFSAIVLGILIYFASQGSADLPTRVSTAAGALDMILPPSKPNMLQAASPDADATQHYVDAARFITDKENWYDLRKDNPDPDKAQILTDMLVAAAEAGKVKTGFLDDFIGVKRGEGIDETTALTWIGKTVITHSERSKDEETRKKAALAVWAYGVRLLEKSHVFEAKAAGISNLTSAWYAINELFPESAEFDPYNDYTGAVEHARSKWERKWGLITNLRDPKIGDLLRFAEYDQDPAFRIMAIQQLGMLQYDPKSPANLEAIKALFVRMKNDPNPTVAKAAEIAEAFTKKELRSMRGG